MFCVKRDACPAYYFAMHRPKVTADHDVVRPIHGAGDLDALQRHYDEDDSCSSPSLFELSGRLAILGCEGSRDFVDARFKLGDLQRFFKKRK